MALLQEWNGRERTIIMGDFNASAGDPEILLLGESGLRDAFLASRAGSREEDAVDDTRRRGYTAPADDPTRRIDYVWMTSDLKARDFSLTDSQASDRLGMAVTVE